MRSGTKTYREVSPSAELLCPVLLGLISSASTWVWKYIDLADDSLFSVSVYCTDRLFDNKTDKFTFERAGEVVEVVQD